MSRSATRKLSIEYSHIYTNQRIGEEYELSVRGLEKALSFFAGNNAVLTVLVDYHSYPDPTFNYDRFIKWLNGKGYKPDVVVRESQLIPACDEVLKLLVVDSKLKRQLIEYIKPRSIPVLYL